MRLFLPGRRLAGLISLGLLLVLGTKNTVQAIDLGCLLINNRETAQSEAGQVVFNLNTGTLSDIFPNVETAVPADDLPFSPDASHLRYFSPEHSNKPNQRTTLYIRSLDPIGLGVKIRDFVTNDYSDVQTIWSQDSHWLGYLWRSADGKNHLGMVDANGRQQNEITLENGTDDKLALGSWYTDSSYVQVFSQPPDVQVFGQPPDQPVTVSLFTLPDLGLKTSFIAPSCTIDMRTPCAYWAPQGHRVAYIGWTDNKMNETAPILLIYSPDTGARLTFTLDEPYLFGSETYWSPDGNYVASITSDRESFSVFGVDGSASQNITKNLVTYFCGDCGVPPAIQWSDDSSSVYFVADGHASVFRAKEKRVDTTVNDIISDWAPGYSRDGRYVLSRWGNPASPFTGLIDTRTGKREVVGKERGNSLSGWLRDRTMPWFQWDDDAGTHLVWMVPPDMARHEIALAGEQKCLACYDFMSADGTESLLNAASPDGRWWLLFTVLTNNTKDSTLRGYLINLDTGQYHLLLGLRSEIAPQGLFAPDSRTLSVITHDDLDQSQLALYAQDGSLLQVLKTGVIAAAWSPDGSMLAYISSPDGIDNLSHLRLDIVSRNGKLVKQFDPFRDEGIDATLTSFSNNQFKAMMWRGCAK